MHGPTLRAMLPTLICIVLQSKLDKLDDMSCGNKLVRQVVSYDEYCHVDS